EGPVGMVLDPDQGVGIHAKPLTTWAANPFSLQGLGNDAGTAHRAAGEGPDQDRGDGRPGLAGAGGPPGPGRGRGGRLPAELLARGPRRAHRRPGGDPPAGGGAGPADRGAPGPGRAEDPARPDPG